MISSVHYIKCLIPGRLFLNGSSNIASLFTQQGKKGTNQDAMIVWEVLNLENMDKTRHWKIVGCSAYTGEGLLEGFDWLVQDMMIP
ncbi:hypothetical protein MANES_01G054104v8 [Manihot esculenta]|uniref:Uncharacterized protein n=5 Tax=Manihot esculenta TaxID=3983 RepID=A0ACB7HEA1_MANES|nr:hypothetical protein MANES_13G085501v8 [Manihot esculenta]KAG8640950.1 hypothetical protein MANES_13G088960v8 [Manihot esculenta]KAG8642703.1 hypothetical protein MANES_12G112901v8 [Manihot esculenta]KAG8650787.1 hypothetical protein MANES_07G069732v8 [Manihot esculenta]KAG8662012.1 hypothetical protein MANES_01G054104v8 [Manihot esculenta]